ncbi:MAG: flagellar protein FliT [Firmicutes bacterium]|nr:flagellar protein FliT [Bacillota bacterium]
MRYKDEGEGRWEKWLAGLREVLVLTKEQGQAFEAKDYSQVEGLLSRRGQLLAQLDDVQDIFKEDESPPPGYLEEADGLLREITRLDDVNRKAINHYLSDLKEDLTELDKWRRAARAYGGGEDIPDRGQNI